MIRSSRYLLIILGSLLTGFAFAKEPFKPNLGPDLPTITVTCGDVTLVLRQASQWTPSRIDYRGFPMTTERSAYGTVFSFNDVGFIGTGHLENEPEPLKSLTFILDGQPVAAPTAEMKGQTFRFERTSRIRNFDLTCIIEIRDNHLHESTTVHTDEAQPLNLVYHFMHAWVPTVTAYLAGQDAEPAASISGDLLNTPETLRHFYINKRVDWMSVYDAKSSQYAVSRLTQTPAEGSHISMIWNVPPTYRKYYLKCFEQDTVPANFTGTWKMTTAFGAVPMAQWPAAARDTAEALKP
jgi:hypothetical protein